MTSATPVVTVVTSVQPTTEEFAPPEAILFVRAEDVIYRAVYIEKTTLLISVSLPATPRPGGPRIGIPGFCEIHKKRMCFAPCSHLSLSAHGVQGHRFAPSARHKRCGEQEARFLALPVAEGTQTLQTQTRPRSAAEDTDDFPKRVQATTLLKEGQLAKACAARCTTSTRPPTWKT